MSGSPRRMARARAANVVHREGVVSVSMAVRSSGSVRVNLSSKTDAPPGSLHEICINKPEDQAAVCLDDDAIPGTSDRSVKQHQMIWLTERVAGDAAADGHCVAIPATSPRGEREGSERLEKHPSEILALRVLQLETALAARDREIAARTAEIRQLRLQLASHRLQDAPRGGGVGGSGLQEVTVSEMARILAERGVWSLLTSLQDLPRNAAAVDGIALLQRGCVATKYSKSGAQ
eukprot:7388231-Prymnesium_polylepis.1